MRRRRRNHDLRHSSASIQLDQGIDITLVSKRLGHSSTTITGTLYAHLLRSTGQRAAETVANAIPRRTQDHAHIAPTTITNEKDRL
ncbi:tyrosine-type recombinase/integrase [Pseudofrankia sp. BMG5.37]|uniref:tyrosine-type recombinase/integrase n=1 Tax=Pseudofrankia sp. BMG5.37 TaxID=3050035 RepID=UPI0028949BB6|nr:tyrosine-type recombinase/integrase [Pseudofrankia sp. BMG5.37]MDT3445159.1 tyrosine-type recombinase/integrase [Pseudofrankia sp. BMG5.37]